MSSIRFSRWAPVMAFAVVALIAGTSWAIFEGLGPSKDEWGLKYEVQITPADADTLTVSFTLADEGRLKPIYSATVVAFSAPDRNGARKWDLKEPIKFQPTADGKRTGQVQMRREFADRAIIRILTQTVDGRRWKTANAAFVDIPLQKYVK